MRKYLFIFKTELMNNLQYVFNILTGFIGYFIILYIFMNLWQYLYSDNASIINGYTMSQMVWYCFFFQSIPTKENRLQSP